MAIRGLTFSSRGSETIVDLNDGRQGTDGITVILSNESHTFSAAADGSVASNNFTSTIQVFLGTTQATLASVGTTNPTTAGTYTVSGVNSDTTNWGAAPSISGAGVVTVSTVPNANTSSSNAITLTIRVNNNGTVQTATRTINLQSIVAGQAGRPGDPGAVGGTISLAVSRRTFTFRGNNTLVPSGVDNSNIDFTTIRNPGVSTSAPILWSFDTNSSGNYRYVDFFSGTHQSALGFSFTAPTSTNIFSYTARTIEYRLRSGLSIAGLGAGTFGFVDIDETDYANQNTRNTQNNSGSLQYGVEYQLLINPTTSSAGTGTGQSISTQLAGISAGYQIQIQDNQSRIYNLVVTSGEPTDITAGSNTLTRLTVQLSHASNINNRIGDENTNAVIEAMRIINPGVLDALEMTSAAFTRDTSINSVTVRTEVTTLSGVITAESESVAKLTQGTQLTATRTTTGGTNSDQNGVNISDDQGNTTFIPDGNAGDDGDNVDAVFTYATAGSSVTTPTFTTPPTGSSGVLSGGNTWYATVAALQTAVPSPANNQRIFTSIGFQTAGTGNYTWNTPLQTSATDGANGNPSVSVDVVVVSAEGNAFRGNAGSNKILRADVYFGGEQLTNTELATAVSLTYTWGTSSSTSDFVPFSTTDFPNVGTAGSIQQSYTVPAVPGTVFGTGVADTARTINTAINAQALTIGPDDVTTGASTNFICRVECN